MVTAIASADLESPEMGTASKQTAVASEAQTSSALLESISAVASAQSATNAAAKKGSSFRKPTATVAVKVEENQQGEWE